MILLRKGNIFFLLKRKTAVWSTSDLLKHEKLQHRSELCCAVVCRFALTLWLRMKCTESEEEEPIKGKESQLQLSCFINQEVKYLATGLRLVRLMKGWTSEVSARCLSQVLTSPPLCPPATAGRNHKDVSHLGKKCPVYKICKLSSCPHWSDLLCVKPGD